MTTKTHLVSISLAIGVLFANAANAVPITLYGSYSQKNDWYDAEDSRAELDCSVSCSGLQSSLLTGSYDSVVPEVSTADGFSPGTADLFYLSSHSDSVETAFVNAVISPDLPTGIRTDGNNSLSFTFTSAAMYILLKIGANPDVALIWNTSGQAQTYTYTGFTSSGAGLGHIMEFGAVGVPEPETFLLLLPGVAAMAMGMRRRKVAVAA